MHRIELLSRAHDREVFDCGSPALNSYLRQLARQHTERGISRTYVLVEDSDPDPKQILGYFSLTICQVHTVELRPEQAKKLPNVVAGVKLARLAVATKLQGQRVGTRLLIAALSKAMDVFLVAGGIGVFVDAKDTHARQFYERFGFVPLVHEDLKLFLPLEQIRTALAT